ncbi:MAG: metallophosphoesterase [Thermodesulfovibrionales bacterium]|nr:metallophosphoesterase [Thermodesulfovibrionales bacterium]
MSTFLLLYFAIYGGLNAYALSKAKAAFALGWKGTLGLALFGLCMVLGPILVRVMERVGMEAPARPIAMLVMLWFGYVFVFASVAVLPDLYRLISLITRGALPALPVRTVFYVVLSVSLVVFVYGVFEARGLEVERISMKLKGLSPGSVIKLVQISDLHLGPTQGEGRLRKVMEAIEAESPDIIVSTGDIVDGLMHDSVEMALMFASVKAPLGKFAVMGNHEYYAGVDYSTEFHRMAGFQMLRDKVVRPVAGLSIVGLDFRERVVPGASKELNAVKLLEALPNGDSVIVLKHVPFVQGGLAGRVALQLSGHTHNGQIFPFNLPTKVVYPYITGTYDLPEGGKLHVSRGTGSWGPPVRVLSPPELTVIELIGAPNSTH